MAWLLLQNSWLHQVNQAVFPHSYFKTRAGPCFNQSWWFDNQLFCFCWFGRDFKPCGSHSASKYRPWGMLGNKSHPQASGSLIHVLVCCYIPTFSAEISKLGRSIVSHICCSPRRWVSVSIGTTDPRVLSQSHSFRPLPSLPQAASSRVEQFGWVKKNKMN
jgi:hypothetical protein